MMKTLLLISLAALMVAAPADAKKKAAKPKTAPAELKWLDGPPGLPAGAQFAVVKGDPTKKGMFTIRAKLPANYAVPAHWHPTDEKVSVVSGKLAYGMSGRLNRTNAQGLSAGEHIVMKAKMNHWVLTADGAEIEVSTMGPFAITYVNPADDPRAAAARR
jgi:quercetin dioxygenase-like cupin family protein